MEVPICPICDDEMTEEEGLYWCDACGINEDSYDYHHTKEIKERMQKDIDSEFMNDEIFGL